MTTHEVQNNIKKLKNKSCSFNDIPIEILKTILIPLSTLLCFIFNMCFDEGSYPSILKQARVIPVFKSGNKTDVSNYRPISNLLTINKIFEKLIHVRIVEFIRVNRLLSGKQYGFKAESSTTLAIFDLIANILTSLKTREYFVCIFWT